MKTRYWILLLSGIFLLSCLCLYLFSSLAPNTLTAEIYRDGILIETVSLSTLTEPVTREVLHQGMQNRILLEQDGVSMIFATCPDNLCVKQGKIKNSLFPIVCLPHGIVIRLRGDTSPKPDAIAR
ncbi:MAG: NusG domain II-containing protein [Clostridia bacterium]|nr:NusG domain II-containing protein [Clostridia bacterium]